MSVTIQTMHVCCRNNKKKIRLLQRCSISVSKAPTHYTASRLCKDYSRQHTCLYVLKKIRRTCLMGKIHGYYQDRLEGLSHVFSHFSFRAPNRRSEWFLPLMSHRWSYMLNWPKKRPTSAVQCRWCETAPTILQSRMCFFSRIMTLMNKPLPSCASYCSTDFLFSPRQRDGRCHHDQRVIFYGSPKNHRSILPLSAAHQPVQGHT